MIRSIISAIALFTVLAVNAQKSSENGWSLPTKDTLRVLVLYVEIDYDTSPELDGLPEGKDAWPVGSLPAYADSLFDPFYREEPYALMSAYYDECSLGNLVVLGDYVPNLFTIPYSTVGRRGYNAIFQSVSKQLEEFGTLLTSQGLSYADFDLWEDSPGSGLPKIKNDSIFSGIDHAMVLIRNYHKLPKANGRASGSSFGIIGGKRTDTYSVFNGGHRIPFQILRHELNHLFLGGNNFHAGGGNSPNFQSYVPFIQGGWSMMGAAHSSFLTCAGWDRYRLGWKAKGNKHLISARAINGDELNADLSRENGNIELVLRDFATTGDAARIKVPFIPENEFQQWIWLENHQTFRNNGSRFDKYHYEHAECMPKSEAGLFAYMQIDAEKKTGSDIYSSVNADYLRPMPADGNFDFQWEDGIRDLKPCINYLDYIPYYTPPEFENPLTGNHCQEKPFYTTNSDTHGKETMRENQTRRVNGEYERQASFGHPRNGFRLGEKSFLGIGSNPSTSSMLTLLNRRKTARDNSKNNRRIYLSGISVEIIEELIDGAIRVLVRFDDHQINETRRWCAPEIILNDHRQDGADLVVNSLLRLDRGETMTRFDNPDTVKGKLYFNDPTKLILERGSELQVNKLIEVDGKSSMTLRAGSKLNLSGGDIRVLDGDLKFELGSSFDGNGKIKVRKGSVVLCEGRELYESLKGSVKPTKRLVLAKGR